MYILYISRCRLSSGFLSSAGKHEGGKNKLAYDSHKIGFHLHFGVPFTSPDN